MRKASDTHHRSVGLYRWMDENDQLRDLVQGLERRLANRAPKEREAKAKERAQREVRAFTSLCSPRLPCCIRMHV